MVCHVTILEDERTNLVYNIKDLEHPNNPDQSFIQTASGIFPADEKRLEGYIKGDKDGELKTAYVGEFDGKPVDLVKKAKSVTGRILDNKDLFKKIGIRIARKVSIKLAVHALIVSGVGVAVGTYLIQHPYILAQGLRLIYEHALPHMHVSDATTALMQAHADLATHGASTAVDVHTTAAEHFVNHGGAMIDTHATIVEHVGNFASMIPHFF